MKYKAKFSSPCILYYEPNTWILCRSDSFDVLTAPINLFSALSLEIRQLRKIRWAGISEWETTKDSEAEASEDSSDSS